MRTGPAAKFARLRGAQGNVRACDDVYETRALFSMLRTLATHTTGVRGKVREGWLPAGRRAGDDGDCGHIRVLMHVSMSVGWYSEPEARV